jgi:hypothetical protein
MPTHYERAVITPEEAAQISTVAHQITRIHDMQRRTTYIAALLVENVKMWKEINDHREKLGFEPMNGHPIELK